MPTALERIRELADQIGKNTKFYVYCPEHIAVYYQAEDDNFITRGAANNQARDHNSFFSDHHAVVMPAPTPRL